jgi:pSer/pThr/pTyr-binding forkhead associated (FHA) protein
VRSPEPPSWKPEPPAPPSVLDGFLDGTDESEEAGLVARLVISSGETVDLDRVTVIGRAPESKQFLEDDAPRLVTVPSAHFEISSAHIEVRPGEGTAVVTDLGSTNGTVVVQPGLGPQDLAPGDPVQLLPGALIDIGDGITIQVVRA